MIHVPHLSLEEVLAHWLPDCNATIEPFVNHGGLSGSKIWKVSKAEESYCLRRWPDQPGAERFAEIHGLLSHFENESCSITPTIFPTVQHDPWSHEHATFVYANQCAWELQTWLPGTSVPHHEFSAEKVRVALVTLAQIHKLAARPPLAFPAKLEESGGLQKRLKALVGLQRSTFKDSLGEMIARSGCMYKSQCEQMFGALLSTIPLVLREVQQAARRRLPLQWILGDVHREHFLFTESQVTGVVDFGAVCIDSRVRDIARLLDSIALDNPQRWHIGLDAYQQVSALAPKELATLAAFDAGGIAVAAYRWLHWLVVEGRDFDRQAVTLRLEHLTNRLEALACRGRASVLPTVSWR